MAKNVRQKLMEIQSKLKAPKNQYNSFGKYKYRSLEDILEAVKPLLAEQKCILLLQDEFEFQDGLLVCNVAAVFADCESDDFLEASGFAAVDLNKKGMDYAQACGASSSYARKYTLNGLFLIDDTRDADATNDHGKSKTLTKMDDALFATA